MSNDEYREHSSIVEQYRERGSRNFTPFVFRKGTQTMPFRLEFPHCLEPGKKYPLLLLLHGAGSLGTDNVLQLFTAELYASHPNSLRGKAFLLAPQCPVAPHWIEHGTSWLGNNYRYSPTPTSSLQMAMDILDYVIANFPVDTGRMAVGGCSMGGYGTWDLLSRRPGLFKAAFPICGCGDTDRIRDFENTSLWFFHGAKDATVSPQCSTRMADALTQAKMPFNFTEFPQADHDAWTPTFAMDDFHRWLNECLMP